MKSLKLNSCYALASAAVIGIAACSNGTDSRFSPTGPSRHEGTEVEVAVPQTAELCKVGPAGTYNFTVSTGGNLHGTDVVLAAPALVIANDGDEECVTVFTRPAYPGGEVDLPASVTITELDAPGTTLESIDFVSGAAAGSENEAGRTVTVWVNAFHSSTATFTNVAVHEPGGCTYTKGWYRNNGSNTIIAGIDGRTIAQQQAIFNATPGKPGSVTFGADNNNLNLYQQLLAALNNLEGDATAGPAAVDAAISAALAATGGSGTAITVAGGTDVSGLISVLSAFNEGQYTDWPHCDD